MQVLAEPAIKLDDEEVKTLTLLVKCQDPTSIAKYVEGLLTHLYRKVGANAHTTPLGARMES